MTRQLTLFSLCLFAILNVGMIRSSRLLSDRMKPLIDRSSKRLACLALINSKACEFNGIKLFGKVQFVSSFPDIKIKYVSNFADIKVKFVENFPDECGEWQVVENFPEIKVQVVENFPDLEVQLVEHFPGME